MTDTVASPGGASGPADFRSEDAMRKLRRRYAAEARFKIYGIVAIGIATTMLVILLTTIVMSGLPAFMQTYIRLQVPVASDLVLRDANYQQIMTEGLNRRFPDISSSGEVRDLGNMLDRDYAEVLRDRVIGNPDLIGQQITLWVPAAQLIDLVHQDDIDPTLEEMIRGFDRATLERYDMLDLRGALVLPEDGEPGPGDTRVELPIEPPAGFDPATADFRDLVQASMAHLLVALRPNEDDLPRIVDEVLGPNAVQAVETYFRTNPQAVEDADGDRIDVTVPASERYDRLHRLTESAQIEFQLADVRKKLAWYDELVEQGAIEVRQAYTHINLDLPIDADYILQSADYQAPFNRALYSFFPEVDTRGERRALRDMISPGGSFELRRMVLEDPSLVGETVTVEVPAADPIDQLAKGEVDTTLPERLRRVSDDQLGWYQRLDQAGLVSTQFNVPFFTQADSRQPELAGIWGAVAGSAFTLFVTLLLAFPIGVSAAIYLEEFAPKNRITDAIEVNINNLAAVPSIVFGLLGLAVFIQFFGLPRSAPLVGGMVLALMTLPTIIIASRAALKAVPPSIREAALGMGASKLQAVLHHVLPLAMPGILTGTIIGMAQALGETAPLLMIGMVAFITSTPDSFTDPATVLPVQIYLWSDSPERGFVAKTSAAIMVLLAFLILMNGFAIWLRKKFERRW
jgi:phosphate transport system permease protein